MFYFPRELSFGQTENFVVSIHKYTKPVKVRVTLRDSNKVEYSVIEKYVQPETPTIIKQYIGLDAPNPISVVVEGFGETEKGYDWYFRNSSDVIYLRKQAYNIFIQTDRPVYKPGQKIKGRVVVVNSTLHPVEGKLKTLIIESPSGTRMEQWRNVLLDQGVASFELLTSEKPVLGKWAIKASMFGITRSVIVELKEFVLPKFQVTITPPSYLTLISREIKFVVCGKYSYGKFVYGRASVKICRKHSYYYEWLQNKKDTCITRSFKIYGCRTVTVPTEQLEFLPKKINKNPYSVYRFSVHIDAEIKEAATGTKLNATTVSVPVENNEVFLSFETRESFKPGLPLSIKLFAKYPDGTPITSVNVILNVGTEGYNRPSNIINNEEITIKNGVYNVRLPPIPYDASKIHLHSKYVRAKLYEKEQTYKRTVNAYEDISPWYSPSHSYLQIEKPTKPFQNGSAAEFTVHYTTTIQNPTENTFYYSVMCAGDIAKTGRFNQTLKGVPRYPSDITDIEDSKDVDLKTDNENLRSSYVPVLPILTNLTEKFSKPTRPPLPKRFSSNNFRFSFVITKNMFPFCRMVVYYIHDKEIVADSIQFDVADQFENKVSIGFGNDEVKPSDEVTLVMKGYPGSRFALTAVDKSIHFLAKGNDIKQKDLQNVREKQDISPGWYNDFSRCPITGWGRKRRSIIPFGGTDYVDSEKAFLNVGTKVMTNLQLDVRPCSLHFGIYGENVSPGAAGVDGGTGPKEPGKKKQKKSVKPRIDFPETWIFKDGIIPSSGHYNLTVKVPDTITNWYASGFAVSKAAGLGVAKAMELTVFQPFFISLNLPYSVFRGEDVTIPTAVFSYLEKSCVSIKVSLVPSKDEFRSVTGPFARSCLCGGRTTTVLFRIIPLKLGYIPIQVKAETIPDNVCNPSKPFDSSVSLADIVIKKLLVKPEGIEKDYVVSNLICPNDTKGDFKQMTSLSIPLPEKLVPGSIFTKFSVMGDILGSSIDHLDSLLRMPYGCGEQNMLKFAPNIFIMNYLSETNQLNEKIKEKAMNYLRTGYQRQLTFRRIDGSYSAFGERDESGSTWLTAFVLKSYAQAQKWIDIDAREISSTTKWLVDHQTYDGCFESVGMLHNKVMKGGIKTPVTLTAYVLTSLLEAGFDSQTYIAQHAKKCVTNNLEKVNDVYSLCVIGYMAVKMYDDKLFHEVTKKLEPFLVTQEGMQHYEANSVGEEFLSDNLYYQAPSFVIEQTAYMLLATVTVGGRENINKQLPLVRYLSIQRNSLGGWASTQDTVLALQALSEFASYAYGGDLDMELKLSNKEEEFYFEINSENNLVLQTVEDFRVPSDWLIHAKGTGCAVVQAIVNFNVQKLESKPAFDIHWSVSNIEGELNSQKSCLSQTIKLCTSWLLKDESNMAIVDVTMVSGFEADRESLIKAQQYTKGLKEVEIKDNRAVFYFNRLSNDPRCFELIVHQTSIVRAAKFVPISVYDYYDKELSATELYGFSNEQCTLAKRDVRKGQ